MSRKPSMVLGYTRTGLAVHVPARRAFDAASCAEWTTGDHVDAARILAEHGEREDDPQLSEWCASWSKAHRATAKPPRPVNVRGAAETSILPGRRR